jgi:hypothetical protein
MYQKKKKNIFLLKMHHYNVLSPNKPKQELVTKTIEGGRGIKPITKCECNSLVLIEWTKCIDECIIPTRFYSLGQVNSLKIQ